MTSEQKFKGYLGLSVKAGKVVFGQDQILNNRKKMYGVILCHSASENTKERMSNFCAARSLSIIVLPSNMNLTELLSMQNAKVIAISNKGLYNSMVDALEGLI